MLPCYCVVRFNGVTVINAERETRDRARAKKRHRDEIAAKRKGTKKLKDEEAPTTKMAGSDHCDRNG